MEPVNTTEGETSGLGFQGLGRITPSPLRSRRTHELLGFMLYSKRTR